MKMKTWIHILTMLLLTLLVSACGDDPCIRECDENGEHCKRECGAGNCVDADDWGYPKIHVPAGTHDTNLKVRGSYPNQVAEAIDSNQILIDANRIPLVMTIGRNDQWTSWYGGQNSDALKMWSNDNQESKAKNGRTSVNRECQYKMLNYTGNGLPSIVDDTTPSTKWMSNNDTEIWPGDDRLPIGGINNPGSRYLDLGKSTTENSLTSCYYRYGIGLYVGFAPDQGFLGGTTQDDVIATYHIPDVLKPGILHDRDISLEENYATRAIDGYLVRGLTVNQLPNAMTGDRLYFKILDRHYGDNSGGYTVKIKEGTKNPKPGPLEYIDNLLLEPVHVLMRRIYNGLVNNQEYIQIVRVLLAIHIALYGFMFMIGGIQEAKKDVVLRMLKIAVIIQLISPNSYEFFYDHLFGFFVDGVMELASLLMSPFSDYDPNHKWYAMDQLLAKFFSAETNAKISSLLFSNLGVAILVIPILYFSMILFVFALAKALVIYIVGMIAIAMLIALAPFFILFMLFEKTKDLFKEWLDQFISFSLQLIMLFAALGMFATIIVSFMERTIGYRVCWNIYADVDLFEIHEPEYHMFDFRYWMPDISREKGFLWMDANNDGVREMDEFAYRYIDMPYFDLGYEENGEVFNPGDKDLIARYLREKNFINLGDVLIFMASVFFMYAFMQFVPRLANTIQGKGGRESASMFGAGATLGAALKSTVSQGISGALKGGVLTGRAGTTFANTKAGKAMGKAMRTGIGKAGGAVGANMGKLGAKAAIKGEKYSPKIEALPGAAAQGLKQLVKENSNANQDPMKGVKTSGSKAGAPGVKTKKPEPTAAQIQAKQERKDAEKARIQAAADAGRAKGQRLAEKGADKAATGIGKAVRYGTRQVAQKTGMDKTYKQIKATDKKLAEKRKQAQKEKAALQEQQMIDGSTQGRSLHDKARDASRQADAKKRAEINAELKAKQEAQKKAQESKQPPPKGVKTSSDPALDPDQNTPRPKPRGPSTRGPNNPNES